MHININSLKRKRQLLTEYMSEHTPDLVFINETKLGTNNKIKFPRFKIARRDRNTRGGGVAVLIRENLKYSVIDTGTLTDEVIGIEITLNQTQIAIVGLYNPPQKDLNPEVFRYFSNKYERCLFVGDLNSKHQFFGCKSTNNNGNILFDISEELDLQILNDPTETTHLNYATGTKDILDMAFATTNLMPKITDCYVGDDIGSDHLPIHVKIGTSRLDTSNHPISLFRNFKKADWETFNMNISNNLAQNTLNNITDIDNACVDIEQVINNAADLACHLLKSGMSEDTH